jgi:N-acetylmuramoyl-L-alanine amidase
MLNFLKWSIGAGALWLLTSAFVLQDEAETTETNKNRLKTVVIDAGHGGKDPGTRGLKYKEKDIALKIALLVGQKIADDFPELNVIYTRKTDKFVDLHVRSDIANRNKADLFISIHCNANLTKTIRGTETYTMGVHKSADNLAVAKRENDVIFQESNYKKNYKSTDLDSPLGQMMLATYQSAYMVNSVRLASKVERNFKRNTPLKSLGVKQAGFLVLWETAMPSILVETGFLSNPSEEIYLGSSEGQDTIAQAIAQAFASYKTDMER